MIKVLFLIMQFSNLAILFSLSLNVKRQYLTHRKDPIGCYHSGSRSGSDGNEGMLSFSPKLQHYWIISISLFNVISGHSLKWEGSYLSAVGVFYSPSRLCWKRKLIGIIERSIYTTPYDNNILFFSWCLTMLRF